MNDQQGLDYIRNYFNVLFGKRNVDALDVYLDKAYFDDDIGDPDIDHIQNSKEYLTNMFAQNPTIGVDVKAASVHDDVISAFLYWYVTENGLKRVIRKGVANFVLKQGRIVRRHTFLYFEE
jgi:hypothetical protein